MTAIEIAKVFAVLLGAFLAADLWAWLTGESLSQAIIRIKQRDRVFRLAMIALLLVAAAFLAVHFELLR